MSPPVSRRRGPGASSRASQQPLVWRGGDYWFPPGGCKWYDSPRREELAAGLGSSSQIEAAPRPARLDMAYVQYQPYVLQVCPIVETLQIDEQARDHRDHAAVDLSSSSLSISTTAREPSHLAPTL